MRVVNISQTWGQLAASSHFTWERAEKWLEVGRPLSLIALDALIFCTTKNERLNQSLWMRELNPTLKDNIKIECIAEKISEYKQKDNVARVKFAVNKIIANLYE